jgi:DNA-binding CsgD family transcriptional regulator
MSARPPARDLFAGPLGAELERRVVSATEAADALLESADPVRRPDPDRLGELIERLGERLQPAADRELDAHAAALARIRARYESREAAIAGIRAAAGRLGRGGSPPALLEGAPRVLVERSSFERVVLSSVTAGTTMQVAVVHFRDRPREAARARAELRSAPVRLVPPLLEAETLRRRRATVVSEAQLNERAHRPLAAAMGWTSYVVAAVVVRGAAIALIHADHDGRRNVDALDRDVLWEFAEGCARAYDRADLTRTLADQRAELRALREQLEVRERELADLSLAAAGAEPPTLPTLEGPGGPLDDRVVFDGVLTRRELDVLRLLVAGLTNAAVGADLVLSPGTVKFHVNSILRKLGVANRAEAVARYLRLTTAVS